LDEIELEANMDFNQARQLYARLKQQYEQGQISADEFERQMNEVVVTDENGAEWQIGVQTGKWYRYDGQNWVEDVPSGIVQASVPPTPNQIATAASITHAERGPGSFNWLLIGGGLAGLAIIGCIAVVVVLFVFNQDKPLPENPVILQPILTEPVIPQPVITQPPLVTPTVIKTLSSDQTALPGFDPNAIFIDDFSNPASGWDRDRNDDHIIDYENGSYRIRVNKPHWTFWANPNKNFDGDVIVEVDATKTGGPDDNEFGVICRYQNTDNFYLFTISSDGFAIISKIQDGKSVGLSSEMMQSTDAIHQGAASNHIRAECKGNSLTLFVNDEEVANAVDSSFANGDVGLIVSAFDTPGVDILFDNFSAASR